MSTSEDTAMVESSNKTLHFKLISHSKMNKKVENGVVEEGEITHNFIYPMRIFTSRLV